MLRGGPAHPKTHRLAELLRLEQWGAVGILESLFHWTAAYARRGDVGRHSDVAIARGLGWMGDAAPLIAALVESGWLDRCECHRLRVHDWPEHADNGVRNSKVFQDQGFLDCYRADAIETPGGIETGTGTGNVEVEVVFDYWRQTMQHNSAKLTPQRQRLVKARLKDGYTVEELKAAIDGCAASPWHRGENDRAQAYDDIALICRDGEHVEKFMRGPTTTPVNKSKKNYVDPDFLKQVFPEGR